ncbi:transposase [Archangium violaceum]|uniref:transposase n=1 Tax=Archangium violaceum TaxID=83451 RepID=UPI00193BA738|nr:transposase [Archangium violaceum]
MRGRRTRRSRYSSGCVFTGLELLRRVTSLVPPPRANLTRFHGVFAPGAQLRPFLVPQAGVKREPEEESPSFAEKEEEPKKERTLRWDQAGLLRRTESTGRVRVCEVWRKAAGAGVGEGRGGRAIVEHLGQPPTGERQAPAREPPQAAWC